MWPTLIPILGSLLDKLFPDPSAAAAAKLQVMQMAQTGELAQLTADTNLALGQVEINKVEAASSSLFVAGWRPFVGWICGFAFAFKFVLGPLVAMLLTAAGYPVVLPVMDFTEMSTILLGMLGLGALRTVEKVKKVGQ
jgi:hypothetical protein